LPNRLTQKSRQPIPRVHRQRARKEYPKRPIAGSQSLFANVMTASSILPRFITEVPLFAKIILTAFLLSPYYERNPVGFRSRII
jgi:hypothetical protein